MIEYKYNEASIVNDLIKYIDSTYDQHYVGNKEIQTFDVWESLGIESEMCRGTAIKYLMRLGKKEGVNKKDILKSIHYLVLLMHFHDKRGDFL